jgi:hypothetical protein
MLEERTDASDSGPEVERPLVGVYVMDQTHHGAATPEWREERYAVLDVQHHVCVAEPPPIFDRRAEVLRILPAGRDYLVGARRRWAATQQDDIVASACEPSRDFVDDELRSARLGVREFAPGKDDDAHGEQSPS